MNSITLFMRELKGRVMWQETPFLFLFLQFDTVPCSCLASAISMYSNLSWAKYRIRIERLTCPSTGLIQSVSVCISYDVNDLPVIMIHTCNLPAGDRVFRAGEAPGNGQEALGSKWAGCEAPGRRDTLLMTDMKCLLARIFNEKLTCSINIRNTIF